MLENCSFFSDPPSPILVGEVLPAAFAFLPGKSGVIYQSMWSKIQEHVGDYTPNVLVTDMEVAAGDRMKRVFGAEVQLTYCWFHLRKALREHLGASHILTELSNPIFNHMYRTIVSLAFIPAEEISQVMVGCVNRSR